MKKALLFVVISIILFLAPKAYATDATEAGSSAQTVFIGPLPPQPVDDRALRLRSYLSTVNSPLVDQAEFFVSEADRLALDWRLVAAISGVESTFGKAVPRASYNGWGWAIFTGNADGKHFTNWEDGITQVSEGLKYRYIDRGAKTIAQIGRIYAASPTWASRVQFFINEIESYTLQKTEALAMTI